MATGSASVTPTAYCSWCFYRWRGCGVRRSKGVKGLISLVQLQLMQQVTDARRSALPLLATFAGPLGTSSPGYPTLFPEAVHI